MHNNYGKQSFDIDSCFLCGKTYNGAKTVEHVFPKWLQNSFELWDQKIRLLNGTLLPYRRLTIPCCKLCNVEHLSKLENEVKNSLLSGYASANRLSSNTWYLWGAKLFYGVLRK